jgi:hypothetical protein
MIRAVTRPAVVIASVALAIASMALAAVSFLRPSSSATEVAPTEVAPTELAPFPDDHTIAYRALYEKIEVLPPVEDVEDGEQLPGSVLVEPGRYAFGGVAFDLSRPGVYRFWSPEETAQRIVVGSAGEFMSAVAWVTSHGIADNTLNPALLDQAVMWRKVSVTCGEVSVWILDLARRAGFEARFVTTLTLDRLNESDNGHSMVEIRGEDGWELFDVDNNTRFAAGGRPLSLAELVERIPSGNYDIERLAADTPLDPDFGDPNSDFAFYGELIVVNEDALRSWYARVIQVPGIRAGDDYYFAGHPERIESYASAYHSLDTTAWQQLFY